MNRRAFLHGTAAIALGTALSSAATTGKRPRRILLRSSWQTVNIGDIAHTPGVIRLLQEYLPEAEITLWPVNIGYGVEEMLRKNFPKLRIAQGDDYTTGTPETPEVRAAFEDCDLLIHGSGPALLREQSLLAWRKTTGKPYGVYGITFSSTEPHVRELLSGANFVFFRDSVSLQFAKDNGVKCPIMEFGPDGAFAMNCRNDEAATAFLREHRLEEGKFMCVIPRYRVTPYWKIHDRVMQSKDELCHALNERMKEHDHAPIREAICAVVRNTEMKILVCAEDVSQVKIGEEMLLNPLPADVIERVVWRDKYWLTDEAVSTYTRSAGLFGLEMHSSIMAIGNGIPAIVCRFREQTSKGIMWRDIGLGEWLFNLDEENEIPGIVPAVLAMAKDPAAAKAKAAKAQEFVHQRQKETMTIVGKAAGIA
ncbi:MAG: polysaccharide pyruvyl transferase family protein [Gloeobacteraceae cyanobacterium ES-bin-144]|nr:polysaccharide pyruvyl transferase family protein [Verrucomicrobiales bacterium]